MAPSNFRWFIIPVTHGTTADGWLIKQAPDSKTQAAWTIAGYLNFGSQADAQKYFNAHGYKTPGQTNRQRNQNLPPLNITNPLASWLQSIGGAIGSGLEGAAVAFLKDIWNVILGPLEILAGAALGIVILAWAFKDDLMSVAAIVARGAA